MKVVSDRVLVAVSSERPGRVHMRLVVQLAGNCTRAARASSFILGWALRWREMSRRSQERAKKEASVGPLAKHLARCRVVRADFGGGGDFDFDGTDADGNDDSIANRCPKSICLARGR